MKEVLNLSSSKFTSANAKECRSMLKALRWSGGFVCPACGNKKAYQLKTRDLLECANKGCKRQTSPTAGTQFHNSRARCLEGLWAILSNNQNKLGELSKSMIKRFMNVSTKTASRVMQTISLSFKTKIGNVGKKPEAARSCSERVLRGKTSQPSGLLQANSNTRKSLQNQGSKPRSVLLFPLFEEEGIEFLIFIGRLVL